MARRTGTCTHLITHHGVQKDQLVTECTKDTYSDYLLGGSETTPQATVFQSILIFNIQEDWKVDSPQNAQMSHIIIAPHCLSEGSEVTSLAVNLHIFRNSISLLDEG